MTGSLDAQTVRDALGLLLAREIATVIADNPPAHTLSDEVAVARALPDEALAALDRLVASVEAASKSDEEWDLALRNCDRARALAEARVVALTAERDAWRNQHDATDAAYRRRLIELRGAEARVVALTAERKQELGGDGLGADAVAQADERITAIWERLNLLCGNEFEAALMAGEEAFDWSDAYADDVRWLLTNRLPASATGAPPRLLSLEEALRETRESWQADTEQWEIATRALGKDNAALLAEIERLEVRGGIARSLIPAARVKTFHERCDEFEQRRALAASVEDKEPPDLTSSTTAAKVPPVQVHSCVGVVGHAASLLGAGEIMLFTRVCSCGERTPVVASELAANALFAEHVSQAARETVT